MKTLEITRIELTNPILSSYVKTIESWDEKGSFISKKKTDSRRTVNYAEEVAGRLGVSEKNGYFYGIFLDDKFLAASKMEVNLEEKFVNISLINGSVNHSEKIDQYATQELTNIASAKYTPEGIAIKKIGVR